jgi:ABC-2 type transport system permease protein
VLGKILGAATLAWLQGLIFLAFAPMAGVRIGLAELAPVVAAIFLISFTLTGMGFVIAWRMNSSQGFHAIMNLFLIPMWFLSGSFFPAEGAPGWLRAAMAVNPLTYGVASLRRALDPSAAGLPSASLSVAVTLAFALGAALAATAVIARYPAGPDRAALRPRRRKS